jgi:phosphotransferase family enzyme
MRVPTDDGPLWFKASIDALSHDAAVITILARRRPDAVPELAAADLETGWMLMRDGGVRMREAGQDLARWEEMLACYAELQIDAEETRDELLAHRVPDRRLAIFPDLFEQMLGDPAARGDGLPEALTDDELRRLHERSPEVRAMCEQLTALGVPETIQHDDLHDANVFLRDGRFVFFDWGDSCVSHPLLSMMVPLYGVLARLLDPETGHGDVSRFRDAYLEPFTHFAPRPQLLEASPAAIDLGVICRGLSWLDTLGGIEAPHGDEWGATAAQRLRWFLEPS